MMMRAAPKSIAGIPLLLLAALFTSQCGWQGKNSAPGAKTGAKTSKRAKSHGLTDVRQAAPGIRVELRYATRRNITGRAIYPANMPPLLQTDTARRLARAQRELQRQGYGLKVWDAYRPPKAHMALWQAAPNSAYVVPPKHNRWSYHTQGLAVDVTLVDANGREMRMPTGFDEFSPAARSRYIGSDPEIRRNLRLLQSAMRNAGFGTIPTEWWHFENRSTGAGKLVLASQLGLTLPEHVRRIQIPR